MITNIFVGFAIAYFACGFHVGTFNYRKMNENERGGILLIACVIAIGMMMVRFTPSTVAWF